MLRFGTIKSVAQYLGVSWDLVKEIHRSTLRRVYGSIPLYQVQFTGIDEFSTKRGHEYMTIFANLKIGRILKVVEGKGKEAVTPFLQTLARKAKRLNAIAMDMNSAYFWAVHETLPDMLAIFDRYYVMAVMNQTLDGLRREHQLQLDNPGKKALKGARLLLLRNTDSLTTRAEVVSSAYLKSIALSMPCTA